VVDDDVVAVMGPGGSGKSTTAAGLVKSGCQLLSDDITALRTSGHTFHVSPGYPQVNLWPDAAEMLFGSKHALPRLTPIDGINRWYDKRYLKLDAERQFHREPLPLRAVYILGDRSSGNAAPFVQPLTARQALMALVEHTYMNYALDNAMRAREFNTLADLVRSIPVRLVTPHSSPDRLPDLCEAILEDFDAVRSTPRLAGETPINASDHSSASIPMTYC